MRLRLFVAIVLLCAAVPMASAGGGGSMTILEITFAGDSNTSGNNGASPAVWWVPGKQLDTVPYKLLQRLEPTSAIVLGTFTPWSGNNVQQKYTATNTIVYNAGIGGSTSESLLARFSGDVLGHASQHIFVSIGVNDVSLGIAKETTVGNVLAMHDATVAAGKTFHLIEVTPWNGGNATQRNNIDLLNVAYRQMGVDYGFEVVPAFDAVESPDGSQQSTLLQDSVHLTGAGASLVAAAVDVTLLANTIKADVRLVSEPASTSFKADVALIAASGTSKFDVRPLYAAAVDTPPVTATPRIGRSFKMRKRIRGYPR